MKLLKELSTIGTAIAACVMGILFIPIGLIYTIGKPFYDYRKEAWKSKFKSVGLWLIKVLYQIWVVIRYIFWQIGFIIDLYGNVLVGELIEDIVTAKENTLLGKGDITISAALGDLLRDNKLNGRGIWLTKVLSFLDFKHENHCLAAIELYEFKKNQK